MSRFVKVTTLYGERTRPLGETLGYQERDEQVVIDADRVESIRSLGLYTVSTKDGRQREQTPVSVLRLTSGQEWIAPGWPKDVAEALS